MSIKNSCFISYRNTGNSDVNRFVECFVDQLKKHLAICMPSVPVFFDKERLNVGDHYNKKLAFEICQSACMVLLLSPLYFDDKNTYCAREYKGMVDLENKRLKKYTDNVNQGLIFPLVLEGEKFLPREIKSHTHYLNLTTL